MDNGNTSQPSLCLHPLTWLLSKELISSDGSNDAQLSRSTRKQNNNTSVLLRSIDMSIPHTAAISYQPVPCSSTVYPVSGS
jgi:hypothetical protein